MLSYLRQNTIQTWQQSLFPTPGVVHLNLPLREPLAPIAQPEIAQLKAEFVAQDFFGAVGSNIPINRLCFCTSGIVGSISQELLLRV